MLLFALNVSSAEYEKRILVQGRWGDKPGEFGFNTDPPGSGPLEFSIDPITKDIYIIDLHNNRIQVFDSTGRFLKIIARDDIKQIRFDDKGYIYTSEYGGSVTVDKKIYDGIKYIEVGKICKYDRNWNLIEKWSGKDKESPLYPKIYTTEKIVESYGGTRDVLFYPWIISDFKIGKSGNIYIDAGGRIKLVLDENGKLLYWSKGAEDIIEDPFGNIYKWESISQEREHRFAYLGKAEKGKFPKSTKWDTIIQFSKNRIDEYGRWYYAFDPLKKIDREGNIYIYDGDKKIIKHDNKWNIVSEIMVIPNSLGCTPIVDDEGNIYQMFCRNKDLEKEERKIIEEWRRQDPENPNYISIIENEKYLTQEEKQFDGFRIYKWVKK